MKPQYRNETRYDMAKVFVLREGFLDRVRKMSGLKSEEAFAGALHVSLEELQTAERLRNPSPNVLVGLFEAFGATTYYELLPVKEWFPYI